LVVLAGLRAALAFYQVALDSRTLIEEDKLTRC